MNDIGHSGVLSIKRGEITGALGPPEPPLTGLPGLKQNWLSDLLAGILVFLIALPLCLGISLASGVPPMAGIIAAVVGGLVVSRISGTYVTINGPAAGLIVVILAAVESLGGNNAWAGYRLTLAAIVVTGLIQIAFGLLRAGRLSSFFPAPAVHGLLSSIGIVIMVKQFYVMMGLKALHKGVIPMVLDVPAALRTINPELAIIGVATLSVMLVTPRLVPRIPAALVAVLVGTALGVYFDLEHQHTYLWYANHQYTIGPDSLVTLPGRFVDGLVFPDFSAFFTYKFFMAVLSISLIASLETLLSAAAVDKLDPYQRKADLNRDLTAIGVGTTLSGLLGGLPMIAEIVRSSANVNNGARTGWANFFHGALMLGFVALAPGLIHHIPLASLAALLVYTGYRLASPKEFVKTWKVGPEQLAIFLVTIAMTLATDLLVGILSGVIANLLFQLLVRRVPVGELVKSRYTVQPGGHEVRVTVQGSALFSNLMGLQAGLASVPQGLDLVVDLSQTWVVDHTVMEYLQHFGHDYLHSGGHFSLSGWRTTAACRPTRWPNAGGAGPRRSRTACRRKPAASSG